MSYELASVTAFGCADRRARYRPNRQRRSAGVGKSYPIAVPSGPSERSAREGSGAARWRRIEQLSRKLSGRLSEDTRLIWLELEQALHAHWLDVARDHYRRGLLAGSAQRTLSTRSSTSQPPEARLRALIIVLSAIADELEGQ